MNNVNFSVAINHSIADSNEVKYLMLNNSSSEDDTLDVVAELHDESLLRVLVRFSRAWDNTVRKGNDTLCHHIVDFRIAVVFVSAPDELRDSVDDEDFFDARFEYTCDMYERIDEFVKTNIVARMKQVSMEHYI